MKRGDNKVTVIKLRELVRKSRETRGWNPNLKNIAISLALESAELLEHFQWEDWEETIRSEKEKEEIKLEVADIIYYLCEFADKIDMDLSATLREKLKIIDEKYPADLIKKRGNKFYYAQKKKYRTKK